MPNSHGNARPVFQSDDPPGCVADHRSITKKDPIRANFGSMLRAHFRHVKAMREA